jgi:hypothetical protein
MGLSAVLAAALLAACGSDDGTDGGEDTGRAETTPSGSKLVRFSSPRIPFTFEYPKSLKVGVRRTAGTELRPRRYLDEFRRDLEGDVRAVTTREERIGDLDVGVLEVEEGDSTSISYFFSGAGRTWQIECTEAEETACRTAVESVDFNR